MEYIISNLKNEVISTNIANSDLINDIINCTSYSEIVICRISNKQRRQGVIILNSIKIFLTCYDSNVTNKIFKHYFTPLSILAEVTLQNQEIIKNQESKKTRRLKHNLINHNSNILQELYKLFSQDEFKNGANHLQVIQDVIKKDTKKASFTFLKVLKNSNLMKAEFDVYEMLDQEKPYLDVIEHSIHKVVILTLNPFWLDLIENNISINLQSFNERILIDYKTISVALSHIFDNATKYICPNTDFKIQFSNSTDKISIIFDMISLKVDKDEIENIFKENISGQCAIEHDLNGDGIGMYMIRKLVRLNKGEVIFKPNVDEARKIFFNHKPYENNIIEIQLNK